MDCVIKPHFYKKVGFCIFDISGLKKLLLLSSIALLFIGCAALKFGSFKQAPHETTMSEAIDIAVDFIEKKIGPDKIIKESAQFWRFPNDHKVWYVVFKGLKVEGANRQIIIIKVNKKNGEVESMFLR